MKHQHFQIIIFLIYILLATFLMIVKGIGITPDRYIFVLFVGALLIRHTKYFVHDFAPFLLIILGYDFVRGFADDLNQHAHYLGPIEATKWLFNGHIPTVELQNAYFTPGFLHWYDYAATFLYLLHFAIPLLLAFIIWFYNREQFREFMLGLVLLSYAGLLSFIAYPTAPPWLAAQQGYIPHVTKILNVVLLNFPQIFAVPTFYNSIGQNLVAAIPSMHTAYSFLTLLFAVKYFNWKGLVFLPYVIGMWLTIVYLGEHYFIDILVGGLYALVVFLVAPLLAKRFHRWLEVL